MGRDDLRAAAEQLLRERAARHESHRIAVEHGWKFRPDEVPEDTTDGELLATAYLSEHPVEDDDSVTAARLMSVGFRPEALMKRYTLSRNGVYASPPCGHLGWWWGLGDSSGVFRPLPAPRDWGGVRRLLAVLGESTC